MLHKQKGMAGVIALMMVLVVIIALAIITMSRKSGVMPAAPTAVPTQRFSPPVDIDIDFHKKKKKKSSWRKKKWYR